MSTASLDAAALVALAGLPAMGPSRLRLLLHERSATDAWAIAAGDAPAPAEVVAHMGARWDVASAQWRAAARCVDPQERLAAHALAGISVTAATDPSMPAFLANDPEPPVVLFHTSGLDRLAGPRVAIVGTRRATRYGIDVAHELGHDLAAAGVLVVSGLASGIDGAAHRGALLARGAPPVAVVGSGPDVVYPPRHRGLWAEVIASGVLLSEHPLGAPPSPWHFPARNRIVAAAADVVVVVESKAKGGSLYTVDEALARDVPVQAVPGSVRSPASVGTNRLLADGAAPCRDAGDVLDALGLVRATRTRAGTAPAQPSVPPALAPVLAAVEWEPITFDALLLRVDVAPGTLATALGALVDGGWLQCEDGWYERPGGPQPTSGAGQSRSRPAR